MVASRFLSASPPGPAPVLYSKLPRTTRRREAPVPFAQPRSTGRRSAGSDHIRYRDAEGETLGRKGSPAAHLPAGIRFASILIQSRRGFTNRFTQPGRESRKSWSLLPDRDAGFGYCSTQPGRESRKSCRSYLTDMRVAEISLPTREQKRMTEKRERPGPAMNERRGSETAMLSSPAPPERNLLPEISVAREAAFHWRGHACAAYMTPLFTVKSNI